MWILNASLAGSRVQASRAAVRPLRLFSYCTAPAVQQGKTETTAAGSELGRAGGPRRPAAAAFIRPLSARRIARTYNTSEHPCWVLHVTRTIPAPTAAT
eukprot:COSAG06_NODE_176_length_21031_cov_66.751290_14_plen_99_part_00